MIVLRITEITDSLREALARLMPQLSSRLVAPTDESLRQMLASSTTRLLGAFDGEQIVGLLTLVWYDAPSGRKAWIEDVVVDAACRGAGAGRALVAAAQREAQGAGVDRVMLTSSPAREAARTLYRSMNFIEAETTAFVWKITKK